MPHEAPSLEGWSVWCKDCQTYRPLTACKSVDSDDGTVYTIEVTQEDDEGNVVWEVTGSEAPAE